VGQNMPVIAVTNATPEQSGAYYVVVTNGFGAVTSAVANITVQITPAGAVDGFFRDAGTPNAFDTIYALLPLPDGKLLAGGSFTTIRTNGTSNLSRRNLAAFETNGTADVFNPDASSQITDIVRQRDGKILVGGYFTTISGTARK